MSNCKHTFLHASNSCQTENTHCNIKQLLNCKHPFLHVSNCKHPLLHQTLSNCKYPFPHVSNNCQIANTHFYIKQLSNCKHPSNNCQSTQTANTHFYIKQLSKPHFLELSKSVRKPDIYAYKLLLLNNCLESITVIVSKTCQKLSELLTPR